jgi:hypothetical protein
MKTNFVSKKVLIPAIIAVGLLSTVLVASSAYANAAKMGNMPAIQGSVNVSETMKNFVKENLKTSFVDAAGIAEKQVEGGKIVGGHLRVVQGYLAYTFFVVNPDTETAKTVIVDAGNGSVLNVSEDIPMHGFGRFGGFGHGWAKHGYTQWHNPMEESNQ